jgi:hypothetical protein
MLQSDSGRSIGLLKGEDSFTVNGEKDIDDSLSEI